MQKPHSVTFQEESDIKRIIEVFTRNYRFFLVSIGCALFVAFLINRFKIPTYEVSSAILINEESAQPPRSDVNNFINYNLFGKNQNFQNELLILKSSPVIEKTVQNLDLTVNYSRKVDFRFVDSYNEMPFQIYLLRGHIQPMDVRFEVSIQNNKNFLIKAKAKNVSFKNFNDARPKYKKSKWEFEHQGRFGKLIETPDLAFVLQVDTTQKLYIKNEFVYAFSFIDIPTLVNNYKEKLEIVLVQKDATVIKVGLKSGSVQKSIDMINELMQVYSLHNLERKNHLAEITIDYIEKQLEEISDSLSLTENSLQRFRSSNQLLDLTEQTTGISAQYRDLQNQMAELMTRKRYYDYVADYLAKNEDFSDMIIPASMGIQDQLLNSLMSDLINAQAQRSNLIQNNQEKNPLVQRLTIQIENTRKTITENISAVRKTTEISIEEMTKRIRKIEAEISRLPRTQRQLGGIERKYRLNDAIFNYLLEKRAEAKITQASNLPDNLIIEPAKMEGNKPVSPNAMMNYLTALLLGVVIPFGFIVLKNAINDKIGSQEDVAKLTEVPVLGKIMHNHHKSNNVLFDYPKSSISESYRAFRTNLDYKFKNIPRKVFLVTSSLEGEGKSFNALNLAMSLAQLNRKTILINGDLRKQTGYFSKEEGTLIGLSSYYTNRVNSLEDIILHSSNKKLDYIPCGPIPPNPVELLAQGKTRELFDQLKEDYDCLVVDSTPLAQVSDAYLLMEHADVIIMIVRYNYTSRKIFSLIMKDLHHKGIQNACILLNDNRQYHEQYGYGTGYSKS